MNVLILCTGNSCRSQMARGFLESFDENLIVRSAGTNPVSEVNPMAIKVMAEAGIDISGRKPISVDVYLDQKWDYVITVCDNARETCPAFPGTVKKQVHLGFDDPSFVKGSEQFIKSEFERIRDEIRNSFYNFYLNALKK